MPECRAVVLEMTSTMTKICAIAQEYRTRRNHHRFARHISHLSKGCRIIRRLTSHLNATRFETERFACRCRGLGPTPIGVGYDMNCSEVG